MSSATEQTVIPYEDRLKLDRRWGMAEGDRHFQRRNEVFKTLERIAHRLDGLSIPYAVAGGLSLDAHGFRRLTVDVDILVTRDGLNLVHDRLDGLGYLPPFTNSKNLRDTETGVRIEFLVSGDYPGDGKPKPVAFPDPSDASTEIDGIRYLSLPALVELKLASGMTGGLHRLKDITDVIALIETLELSRDLAESLNPYVRDKYLELWNDLQEPPREP